MTDRRHRENTLKTVHYSAIILLCAGLVACGGGGGGSSSGGPAAPPAGGNGNGNNGGGNFTPADFETAEYGRQYGLGQINASNAYAQGGTGAGVTIAVIDTGIDIDHPELAGQISNKSIDIVGAPRNDFNDTNGHGTAVAGVIASRKNDSGAHGVAFDGQIMAIRADDIDRGQCGNDGCDFFSTDTIAGINYAVANGARVINLSISGPDAIGANYQAALNNAGNQGVVVVAAAGNSSGVNPENPAAFASDARSVGNMLAVGAVDSSNRITAFSNRAGTSASHFVVAAGDRVRTLGAGGGEVLATGTSFSAPHVAGAAAVLIDLFPALTAKQVVDLLRNTATDLGLPGDDAVFGKGLINLQAATAPQGPAQVPQGTSTSGPGISLFGSGAQFAAAFGDGPQRLAGSGALQKVLFLDSYSRGYHANLSSAITATVGFTLEEYVKAGQGRDHATLDLSGYSSKLGLSDTAFHAFEGGSAQNQAHLRYLSNTSLMNKEASPGMSLSGGMYLGKKWGEIVFRLTEGEGMGVTGQAVDMLDDIGALSLFGLSESLLHPFGDIASDGLGMRANWRVSDQWAFGFSHNQVEDHRYDLFDGRNATFTRAGMTWTGAVGGQSQGVSVEAGRLEETHSLLGSSTGGALTLSGAAVTNSITVSAYADIAVPIFDHIRLFGRYTTASTAMDDGGVGLLRDWEQIKADSFSLGMMSENIFRDDDKLGLLIGQPLRVNGAIATLRVPTTRSRRGQVLYESQQVDLSPDGRELRVELSYTTALPRQRTPDGHASLSLFGLREPGHVDGANVDMGIVGRINLPF